MVGWAEMPRSPGHVFYDRRIGTDRGRFRRLLPRRPVGRSRPGGGAFGAAGALFPHAPGGLLRGHRLCARAGMALLGFPVATGVSTAGKRGSCAGPLLAVTDSARLPHEVHTAIFDWVLALIAEAGLVKGERIGVDASTMEANAGAAQHRAEGHGRGLPGDAGALGPRRAASRHPRPRTWRAWTASARARSSRMPGLGLEERPRGQDRQDEGRHDPSGLQARARGGSGHRRGGGRRATPGRRGRRTTLEKTPRRPRRISRRWTRHRRPKTRPNV